jgi:hypothetical protein
MELRVCRKQWTAKAGDSNQLQNRHSVGKEQVGNRGGRRVASNGVEETARFEKGTELVASRVESVTVLQSRDFGRSGSDSEAGDNIVFTLSVEAGNYFADGILVKNCQDSAPVLLDIISRQKAQLILVGDSAQVIYDWRGAIDALKAFPDAPRAYLSQSFRFGPAIAAVANRVLETLEEKTPLRLKGFDKINSVVGPVGNPTAILTRTNAVAVGHLLEALVNGKQAFLVGGGSDVASFVRGAKDLQENRPTNHPELSCFNTWAEVEEYSKEDEGEDLKLMVKLINQFGTDAILNALNAMPEEKDADLIISTAHKSKGREWDRVVLASDFPAARWDNVVCLEGDCSEILGEQKTVPHISQISDSDKRLVYVAVTRAKLELDITGCPFFTGERGFSDFKDAAAKLKANPPKRKSPSTQTSNNGNNPVDQKFTWSKWENSWVVRGPSGKAGEWVDVSRKDNSTSRRKLGEQIKEVAPGVALYQ